MNKIFQVPMAPEIASALERRAQSCGLTTEQLLQRVVQALARPAVRTRRKYERAVRDNLNNEPEDLPDDPLQREAEELETIRRLAGLLGSAPRPGRR
jgi:hypothetical protein